MRRGFKARAERLSLRFRDDCGLSARDPLNPRIFLKKCGYTVWEPKDIPGIDPAHVQQLTVHDPDSWSGVTIREAGLIAIIVNPSHALTRQANTLMHEWAHIELRHKPNRVDRSENGLLLLSDYPSEVEDEANWLAGTMLVPREGLLFHCGQGLGAQQVAGHYGVSTQLVNWRMGATGVTRQLKAAR